MCVCSAEEDSYISDVVTLPHDPAVLFNYGPKRRLLTWIILPDSARVSFWAYLHGETTRAEDPYIKTSKLY